MKFIPMRPQIELQRVHDVLMNILGDEELHDVFKPGLAGPLMMAADCLCWALHHDADTHRDAHAANFGKLIYWLEQRLMEKHGMVWEGSSQEYEIEEE